MSKPKMELPASLIENIFDGICQVDREGRVCAWNEGAVRITGFKAEQVIGTDSRNNAIKYVREDNREIPQTDSPLLATLKDGTRREVMVFIKHMEGYRVSTLARTFPVLDGKGKIAGAIQVFSDNKSVIAAYHQIQRLEQTVLFDSLTGIGNRSHIEAKIKFTIEDYRTNGVSFGILFIDIDHFKKFNDTYGHLTGDKVLRFVANTLRQNLRIHDSCGRWGGEEFIALVLDIPKEGLETVAEKLRALVENSGVEEDGKILKVTISIGATIAQPTDSLQSLIKRADELMYKSKQDGRNRVTID
jgi:diguanylate cyclase (GGDEF)-like protein/PAS domain S-box-containing protein